MNLVTQQLIKKSLQELNAPAKLKSRSRVWQSPTGYKYLVQWSNAVLLRYLVRMFTSSVLTKEYKKKAQLEDAARSTVRSVEEGWKRSNTATYLEFIGFSQGSLEEVKGDIKDMTEDGFLSSKPGSTLKSIGIDLKELNTSLINPPSLNSSTNPLSSSRNQVYTFIPLKDLYPPLKQIKPSDLTYEIFMELIYKTDFLLRRLVESLEKKMGNEQKGYQIEKLRMKEVIKKR